MTGVEARSAQATSAELVAFARRIGEEVLFPTALETDAAPIVPRAHLDLLAEAGLYGLAGPTVAGGLGTDMTTAWRVIEELAAGCLTTTFVWMQHHGAVVAVAHAAPPELRQQWLEPLCRGACRAGVALAGLRPGVPLLRVRAVPGGWILNGTAPWVTGWGRVDVLHTAARDDGDNVVWALIDARSSDTLSVQPLRLIAAQASGTVSLAFSDHFIPDERTTHIEPYDRWPARDAAGLRVNGSLALGVASRCCQLVGPSALDDDVSACRRALDTSTPETLPAARAAAAHLAVLAASTLVTFEGSRSILLEHHGQRLAREAVFCLVFGTRPAIRAELLRRIGASGPQDGVEGGSRP